MAAASDVVSSSSKLWAVRKYPRLWSCFCSLDLHLFFSPASKEWVIPAKPKPGRKPKKDPNTPVNEEIEVSHFPPPLHNLNPNEKLRTVG